MLHIASKVRGFHLHATDGIIGHVDDFLFDEQSWQLRYLVVDTSNWIGGKAVLVSPAVVVRINPANQTLDVSLTREQIRQSPTMDTADVAVEETLPTIWIM